MVILEHPLMWAASSGDSVRAPCCSGWPSRHRTFPSRLAEIICQAATLCTGQPVRRRGSPQSVQDLPFSAAIDVPDSHDGPIEACLGSFATGRAAWHPQRCESRHGDHCGRWRQRTSTSDSASLRTRSQRSRPLLLPPTTGHRCAYSPRTELGGRVGRDPFVRSVPETILSVAVLPFPIPGDVTGTQPGTALQERHDAAVMVGDAQG